MPGPPALKREIVIDNFAGGCWSQGLKEGLGHAVDCAITHDPTRTPEHVPDDRHAKRARPTKEGRARFHALRPLRAEQIRSNTSRASAIDSKDGCGFRPALDPLPE
jgi:hypothetical protein